MTVEILYVDDAKDNELLRISNSKNYVSFGCMLVTNRSAPLHFR